MPSRFLRLPQLTEHTSEREQQNQVSSHPFGSRRIGLADLEKSHENRGIVRRPAKLTGSAQYDRYWFSNEAAMCAIWISRRPGQLAA